MMGKHLPQKNLFSYSVDLDKRVRQNHPLRKVAETVDFSFVREEVKDPTATRAWPMGSYLHF
jgi:hypothetical protein